MHDVDLKALESAVEQAGPRLRAVQIALTAGPLLFLGVVIMLSVTHEVGEVVPQIELIELLSMVHAVIALTMLPLALLVIPRVLLRQAARGAGRMGAVPRLVGALQTVCVLRLALVEGASLFGVVVVLLAVLQGILAEHPLYWANAASCLLLLAVSVTTFPTRGRLQDMLRRALSEA